MSLSLIFVIIALILFVLAALAVSFRQVNLVAAGLAFVMVAILASGSIF